jgi:hypothetical protein
MKRKYRVCVCRISREKRGWVGLGLGLGKVFLQRATKGEAVTMRFVLG